MIDALPKVLVGCYEEPERPPNAVDFIKRYMGAPTGIDVDARAGERVEEGEERGRRSTRPNTRLTQGAEEEDLRASPLPSVRNTLDSVAWAASRRY